METTRMIAPPPALMRFQVRVVFLDGVEETIQSEQPVNVQGDVLVIHTARGGHTGINLRAVRSWEVVGGAIAIATGLQ